MRLVSLDSTGHAIGEPLNISWDFGTELMNQLLSDINAVSRREAPFKIETEDYAVYWAGTILRVDIKKAALSG